jgi:hypothetical protein
MLDGNKYGHRWSEFSWNEKKVEQVKAVVFVSSGIKDEKITDENSIYDTKYLAKLGQ